MTVVVAGALVLLSLLGFGVVRLGVAATARAQAQAAADASALAGVVEGREGAVAIASSNGATLISFADEGTEVEVVVQVGDAVATARAHRLDPPPRVVVLDPPPATDPPPVIVLPGTTSTVLPGTTSTVAPRQ